MEALIDLLTQYGYAGMLVAAFLAGSFFPFSSEAVMLGLLAAGLDGWQLIVYGSIGNVAGGMFNYGIGRLGRLDLVERYLHVKKSDMDRARRFMAGHGAWIGFFPTYPRQCYNNNAGLHAFQHPYIRNKHHIRQIPQIRSAYLRHQADFLTKKKEMFAEMCINYYFCSVQRNEGLKKVPHF